MRVKVLGSSGSESPSHNPPAYLLDDFLLLDAGTITHSLDQEAQSRISHIFLTHAHLDHIKAIPFLLDNRTFGPKNTPVTIWSGPDVIDDLKGNIFNNRIWPDFTSVMEAGEPLLRYREIRPGEPVRLGAYHIEGVPVDHSVPAYGYLVEKAGDGVLAYTGDTGPTERIWKRMDGRRVKGLIVEVSLPDDMAEFALSTGHLTPMLLAAEVRKMAIPPEKLYLCHLKPFYRKTIEEQLLKLSGMDFLVLEDGMVFWV